MTAPVSGSGNADAGYGSRTIVFPVWVLAGPALAAWVGASLLTVTLGPQWTAMRTDLDLPALAVVWVFVAYLLPALATAAVGLLVGGRWPTALVLPGIGLLVLGALLTTFSPGSALLMFARALTGLGAGLAWGVTAALVRQQPAGRARTAWAITAAGTVVALVVGPLFGALASTSLTWRLTLFVAVPIAGVAFLVAAVSGIALLVSGDAGNRTR
ncbi:MFS transporter [Plantactinospora sp. S1510]|uniref:MFS transporter n=1 Tax=Plantactinospora alkalitolerans TaxID=2789879 RepID=A0ABS0GYB5_9ACTN|nr:MFS transporter [Plantactinospora alkalitolerans]MBF9131208.1 MFS transporter [Plantactinospora alkalitolerans]